MSGAQTADVELTRNELTKLVRMQAETIRRLEKRNEELAAKLKEKNPTERLDPALFTKCVCQVETIA